jgi:hypothetical protein
LAAVSEVYNPESALFERVEALALEVRQLLRRRDQAVHANDRQVIERQLRETEDRLQILRRRLHGLRDGGR